jgi:hypothetical protein
MFVQLSRNYVDEVPPSQGDQIGRSFASWVICTLGNFVTFFSFFRNCQSSTISATFFQGKCSALFFEKMSWATYWAIFYKVI